jgi:hypothetical protein
MRACVQNQNSFSVGKAGKAGASRSTSIDDLEVLGLLITLGPREIENAAKKKRSFFRFSALFLFMVNFTLKGMVLERFKE